MDRTANVTDRIDPARAEALAGVLGSSGAVGVGDALPPLAHFAFFWDLAPEADLGADGLPGDRGLVPDPGLSARMWAGTSVTFHSPFRAGVVAEKSSRLTGVTRRDGRSGKLAFARFRHDIRQRGVPVLTEDQTVVYREPVPIGGEPPLAGAEADERRPLKLSEVALFRYSALTYNAHRIHYHAEYCRSEGFPGLVVHGPLLASLLAGMAAERLGPLRTFACKATAPLCLGDVAWLCRAGDRWWVEGPRRRLCMKAEATA